MEPIPRSVTSGDRPRVLLAIYDLDRTITARPTWLAFLLGTAARRSPARLVLLPVALSAAIANALGLVDRRRLKEIWHWLLLGPAIPGRDLRAHGSAFADRVSARSIRPGARTQIRQDRAAGYRVVLATAAHRFYAQEIAERLGITDVIATQAVCDDGGKTRHRIVGDNLYGPAKLAAVEMWLAAEGIDRRHARIRVYSDHVSDTPCLEFADEAFAVNPHRALRVRAGRNGWNLIDWNRPPVIGEAACALSS